ncbi:MAG: hypothetical protein FJ122_13690, partial [Deltaproteobacteria bacterium]|nr:hypothetical protein [Deltaproteobacteria bacterium]
MLSRERVITTLNHREPDRVPIDFGGTSATGIEVTAYDRLKGLLGIETASLITNRRAQLVAVEEAIKNRFHADVDGIEANPAASLPRVAGLPADTSPITTSPVHTSPNMTSIDEWGVHWLS